VAARTRRIIAGVLTPIVLATLISMQASPASAAGLPVASDVKGIKVKPVVITQRPEWTAGDRELTEADLPPDPVIPSGTQTVDVAAGASLATTAAKRAVSKGVKAGPLPVYIAAPPSSAAALTSATRPALTSIKKVRVEVLDRKATTASGVKGLVVKLARADGAALSGQARVTVDYRAVKSVFGGDAATRLRLIRLSDGQPVPAVNDAKAGTLTATMTLAAAGAATAFGVTAAPDGENGDYKATTLTPASTWQVSQQTGAFTWTYPIKAPKPPGGVAPSMALSYNSASIDGRTSGNNTQGAWAGDGWDLWSGYIERSYRACTDDHDEKEKENPNNKDEVGGDLCYFNDNATMSFNGSSTELVKDPSSEKDQDKEKTVRYHGVTDDGSRVEMVKDGRKNGDDDGAYWRVTTIDGVQYHFGRDKGEGGSSAGTKTNSVWAAPVYSNHADEDGYDKEFAKSRVTRAWRWNLDYVVDPSGNTITYFYEKEGGAYGREGDKDKRTEYDRGGYLTRVEYGSRATAAATVKPADRILFKTDDRCIGTCIDKDDKPIAKRFPDTPWEQYCEKAPCTSQLSPTFWTQKRLSKITTQVYSGTGDAYTKVDSWELLQTYLQAGDNESTPMWLKSITHTGEVTTAGGPVVTDPAVLFNPNADVMPNRVDTPSGHPSLFRSRIDTITTETGAQYGISYSKPKCDGSPLPKAWDNTKLCYPQYYGAEGETPKIDWFNKYVVTRVDVYDNTGGFEHQQTNYDYLDTPAWAYDNSELVKPKKRTWGQFRGYGRVRVRQGIESGVQSKTEYRYFRGMDGDKQPKDKESPPVGTPRDVQVEDSFGDKLDDHPAYAGMLREQITYNGTDWIGGVLNTPARKDPTASYGSLKAWKVHIETVRSRTKLSDGKTRWTKTVTKVNDDNLPVEVNDLGDESNPNDSRCARTEYARNEAAWMLDRIARIKKLSIGCDVATEKPADVLSDVLTTYNSRGLPTKIQQLDHWDGATAKYLDSGETGYDELGRVLSQSDALKHTITTAYTPALTGPVTQTTITSELTGTMTTVINPALGLPVKATDSNGGITQATYDGIGRLLAMWPPGRSKATYPKTPTVSYTYELRKNLPSYVVTKTLMPYGSTTYRTSVTLFDGLLRARQLQTQTIAGGRAITDSIVDSRGLASVTTRPYYDVDNTAPNTTLVTARNQPEIPALTQNLYDGAGRLTDALFIVNGDEKWRTTTTYAGEKTSVTPPSGGTATTSIVDARGLQAEARQYKDPKNVGSDDKTTFDATSYSYTDRDEIKSVIGPGNNIWRYTYDLRGNQVSTDDPDNGNTTAEYDAAGQLTWSKDGNDHKLYYEYDAAGRKRFERQDKKDGRVLAEWQYDTLPRGKGRPSAAIRNEYDAAGNVSTYTNAVTGYDVSGHATGTSVTIPASEGGLCASGTLTPCTYTQTVNYRPNGALDQVILPAVAGDQGLPAETLTTLYNEIGLEDGLLGNQIYAQESVYNQFDQLIGENLGEHGSRVGLAYTYDDATGRLTNFRAAPELKSEVYNLTYGYNDAGTITSISDTPDSGQPAEAQCFRYDYHTRLTDAWTPLSKTCTTGPTVNGLGGPSPYWRSYSYDVSGNRGTETIHATTDTIRTYGYPPAGGPVGSKPHAVTTIADTGGSATNQQYSYDGAGNLICRPDGATTNTCGADGTPGSKSQGLAWNYEGRLAKTTDATGDTTFVYDADGNRLIRRDPQGSTLYLPNGTEIRKPKTGTVTATRYYSHAGSTIAVRTHSALTWMIDDHNGTAAATVTSDKTLTVTRRRTLPFGNDRATTPTTWAGDKGFVGGTKDNTGLTHLGAREYDPSIGRFISVDPIMDLKDPQSWNGYGYASNSPISQSDPSGLFSCGTDKCNFNGGDGTWCGVPYVLSCRINGTGGGNGNNGGGNSGGNGGANDSTNTTTADAKEKCGHFALVCNGWQRSLGWIENNSETLGHIALDLGYITLGVMAMQLGPEIGGAGIAIAIGSAGTLAVAGGALTVAGGAVMIGGAGAAWYGAKNLGSDLNKLHWNNEAVGNEAAAGNVNGGLGELQPVNVSDPAADALAGRIGGRASVRFADGPPNEFDAVSDRYVAQAKPANFTLNKKFRNQAKVTFETAIKSGRTPYFQFDGPPQSGVLEVLNRYAERYAVKPIIDLNPLG
jgi:RHS repeat-associated protein